MRRAISTTTTLGVLIILSLLAWGVLGSVGSSEKGTRASMGVSELFEVRRGGFDIRIPASGELKSENQIDIRNQVESEAVVISLVDEGSVVKRGDVLFALNDEKIQENIRNAEIERSQAENEVKTAETGLAVKEKERDSELAAKQLAVNLAELALLAWNEGEVVAKRLQLALAVETAEKNYNRLAKKFESSQKLFDQKFLSKDELDQDEIALLNADAALKKARLDVTVYEDYTYLKDKQTKESDLKQAKDELDRAILRTGLQIDGLVTNLAMQRDYLEKREEKLTKETSQLNKCIVTAPSPGMVVYASSLGDRREEDERLRVGRTLWRNQLVMIIPDTSNMVAQIKVNEALSGLVKKGQRATITCDAYPENVFEGEVIAVGVLASGGGWRDPNRRDYTVEIKINDLENVQLKPSMRCSTEIFVEQVKDELFVPIHAIHRSGELIWVWVQDGNGYSQREVEIGKFSEVFVVVHTGIDEGEWVLLREPDLGSVISNLGDDVE